MELVIITGMSGAGRRTVAHAMEDLGWYVVDNLPPSMLPALATSLHRDGIERVAVVLDVRSKGDLEQIPELFASLTALVASPKIIFLEADENEIVRRQESSRRPVPLQGSGGLLDGIRTERHMIAGLRAAAEMVLDTTGLNNHQLQSRIVAAFGSDQAELTMTVMSFGFKNGVPVDTDMVVDVRFLPNPHWVPDLRPQTGLNSEVSSYVLASPLAGEFLDELEKMINTIAQGYRTEGKRLLTLGVGCTGGKHRSVAMVEEIARRLRATNHVVTTIHRDLGRE